MNSKNLIIIGMPGCGKSTFGRRVAVDQGRQFLDTDELMEELFGCSLQTVLERYGLRKFRQIEALTIRGMTASGYVISTGGSVVYSEDAMNYLSSIGTIVYLKIHLATLLRRVKNKHARGLSKLPGKSLQELYHERLPLYERWAEITLSNDWPLTAWQMDRLMGQLEGQI